MENLRSNIIYYKKTNRKETLGKIKNYIAKVLNIVEYKGIKNFDFLKNLFWTAKIFYACKNSSIQSERKQANKIFLKEHSIFFPKKFRTRIFDLEPNKKIINLEYCLKSIKLNFFKDFLKFYKFSLTKKFLITTKTLNFFSLNILSRYYAQLGSHKQILNFFWKNYIYGQYYNINIINLNYTYSTFRTQNLILLNVCQTASNFLKILIFDAKLSKNFLFKDYSCSFNHHYYLNSWYFGYLTNPLLKFEIKNKNRHLFNNFFFGGIPVFLFFTLVNRHSYLDFLNEFFRLEIPIFGLVDTDFDEEMVSYPVISNTKSRELRIFYLKIFSKIILKSKLINLKNWLFNLKNFYMGFFFKLQNSIKLLRKKDKFFSIYKIGLLKKTLYSLKKKLKFGCFTKPTRRKKSDIYILLKKNKFSLKFFTWFRPFSRAPSGTNFFPKKNFLRKKKSFGLGGWFFRKTSLNGSFEEPSLLLVKFFQHQTYRNMFSKVGSRYAYFLRRRGLTLPGYVQESIIMAAEKVYAISSFAKHKKYCPTLKIIVSELKIINELSEGLNERAEILYPRKTRVWVYGKDGKKKWKKRKKEYFFKKLRKKVKWDKNQH